MVSVSVFSVLWFHPLLYPGHPRHQSHEYQCGHDVRDNHIWKARCDVNDCSHIAGHSGGVSNIYTVSYWRMKAYWYLQQSQAAVDVVIEWFLLQMHGLCRRSFIRDRGTMSGAFYTFWVLQCECKFTYWKKLLRLLFIIMKRFSWNIRADLLISIQSYMYSFIYFLLLLEKPIFLSIYLLRRYDGVSRLCLFAVPGDFR